jgi:hypothetical protein|tara:strand:- start:1025 stop:1453 length:429 start_codon:yes stop_codon:yes gene_type:complete
MNLTDLEQELNNIMEHGLQDIYFPYAKGKSVRIKNIVIRETKTGFLVFDVKKSKRIAETISKRGAIAYATAIAKNRQHSLETILDLDQKLGKHYMDSIFAKNTIESTNDEFRVESALVRFDIAKDNTWRYTSQLDEHIFDER